MPVIYHSDTVAVWKMEETCDVLSVYLSEEEKDIVSGFSSEKRRLEFCCVRATVAFLAGGRPYAVVYDGNGKPALAGAEGLHVSISHTRRYAAVYIGQEDKGIDIEHRADRVRRVKDMFMSADEIAAADRDCELTSLLLHWSAKEAVYKIHGRDVYDFKARLHVSPFKVEGSGVMTVAAPSCRYAVDYLVCEDYVLTLAMRN